MKFVDSLEKVFLTYLAAFCREGFDYRGVHVQARPLIVSQTITRGFTCPERCGACCPRFALCWIPGEPRAGRRERPTSLQVNGIWHPVVIDRQADHDRRYCRYLLEETGRCSIHGRHPIHCDFELIRVRNCKEGWRVGTQPFGRAWALERVTGEKGAACEILPPTRESALDTIRKLRRLEAWADHFGIQTWISHVIQWIDTGCKSGPLRLGLFTGGT